MTGSKDHLLNGNPGFSTREIQKYYNYIASLLILICLVFPQQADHAVLNYPFVLCLLPSRFSLEKVGDPKHRINYAWPNYVNKLCKV